MPAKLPGKYAYVLCLVGIPLLRGRDFDEHDIGSAPPVAITNDTLARRYFPHEDPIGL